MEGNTIEELETTCLCQRSTIDRLERALAPFITAANDADGYPDNHPVGCDPQMPLEGLTVADLRMARANADLK